jgi:hypothetical protein
VEASHTEKESKQPIEVTDPKIIIDMVTAGIMSIEVAQEKLGLDKLKNKPAKAELDYRPPMMTGAVEFDTICDECEFFDDENNWCDANNRETGFDARACTSYEKKRKESCQCRQ